MRDGFAAHVNIPDRERLPTARARHPKEESPAGVVDPQVARLLTLQRTAGNRAVVELVERQAGARTAGSLIQRRALPRLSGSVIGSIGFDLPGRRQRHRGVVKIVEELVPRGARPRRFAGYDSRLLAMARCWEENALCAVIEDDSGRFHAVQTDWPARDPRVGGLALAPVQHRFRGLQWVHTTDEAAEAAASGGPSQPGGSWAERVSRAQRWLTAWQQHAIPEDFRVGDRSLPALRSALEREFVALLAETLGGVSPSDIHVASREGDYRPNGISFYLELPVNASGGIGSLPSDRGAAAPEPVLVFGPSALRSESRLATIATAVHEATHFAHAGQSIRLWNRWRRSRGRLTFVEWLRRRRRGRRLGSSQAEILAEEEQRGGANSECLARTEAFVTTYHRFPLGVQMRFEEVDVMPQYWGGADPETRTAVMQRLSSYIRGLPARLRDDVARHRDEKLEGAATGRLLPAHIRFWERFAREAMPQ